MPDVYCKKKCTKCLNIKNLTDFSKSGEYYKSHCKKCVSKRVNEYRIKNYETIKEKKKKYWEDNKGRFKEQRNKYNEYYRTEKIEAKRKSAREWAARNRTKHRKYCNQRYKDDINYNISTRIRRRIGTALFKRRINLINKDRTVNILGCTFSEYRIYVESKFTEGMTWDKYLSGEIHIDHIKPCSTFDLTNKDQLYKCFHYTNTQPLWKRDNLIKNAKYKDVI